MIPKPIHKLDANDILALIENGVREGKEIEYKRDLPGGNDEAKREFLADVTSFANATGGDIIYGIDEQPDSDGKSTGTPGKVVGIPAAEVDQHILRIEEIIRNGVEPRIPAIQIQPIDGLSQRTVLVLRIPRSWVGPHMISFKKYSRFYTRSSAGKFQMNVEEIRDAFASSSDLPTRITAWRDDRIKKILSQEGPATIAGHGILVLHVIPLESFGKPWRFSPTELRGDNLLFPILGANAFNMRINVDGILHYVVPTDPNLGVQSSVLSYTQVFRSGTIEAVCGDLVATRDGLSTIGHIFFEERTEYVTRRFLESLARLDVSPPFVVMLSILHAKGAFLARDDSKPIDRDVLHLPEVLIDEPIERINLPSALQPLFDAVWNAFGFARSFNYRTDGKWQPR